MIITDRFVAHFLVNFITGRVGQISEQVGELKSSGEHFFGDLRHEGAGIAATPEKWQGVHPADANTTDLRTVGHCDTDNLPVILPEERLLQPDVY